MTREEETKEAYKDYMNNGGMFQSNPWFYFRAGTEWADKHSVNVWHDTSEEPRCDELLLTEESDDFNLYKLCREEDNSWEWLVSATGIIRWAYVSDLLPKGYKK